MGLSSSKTKTQSTSTATPYSPAQPYIDAGLAASNDVFKAQQPQLAQLANTALEGYNAIAPQAYQTSAFVQSAQDAASRIFNGGVNDNPGASTYSSIMGGTNPGLGALYSLQNGGMNGARAGYADLASGGGGIVAPSVGTNPTANPMINHVDSVAAPMIASRDVQSSNVYAPTGAAPSQQLYADTLGGKYLDNNPYIDSIAQQATDAATKAANQRFGAAGLGAGLSSAYSDVVSKNVANAANQVRYQNYSDERSRQLAAAGQSDALYNADAARQLQASTGNADRGLAAQTTNAANWLASQQANQNTEYSSSRDNAANALTAARANQDTELASSRDNAANVLAASQANAANSLAAQNANLGARLSGLAGLSGIDQQQFGNQLSAATGLGSAYAQDASTRLGAATQADAQRNALIAQQLQALGLSAGLDQASYNGVSPALNLLTASAQIPWTGVQALGGTLNTLAGRYGTTNSTGTSATSGNIGQGLMGIGGMALGGWAQGGFK